jgi:N-methylhydantoinase B
VTSSATTIDLEILRRKLVAVAAEMGLQLRKTAQSPEINTEQDYATAIVDTSGAVVATDNPLQLGALSHTAHALIKHYRFDMRQGDIVVTNASDFGGTRAVDISLLMPYFIGSTAGLYFIVRGRVPDLGGMYAGGFNPDAREFMAEGVPLTPMKLYREGREVRDVITTVLLNSRFPAALRLALDALIASMRMGERRVRELIREYTAEQLRFSLDYAQTYVEKRTRAEIATWTPGSYIGEAILDHGGHGGGPLHVRADLTVEPGKLRIDFSRSDADTSSFVSSTWSNTVGFAAVAVLAELGEDVPANDGLFRVVAVKCDPGSIARAAITGPVGWSAAHCGAEILESTSRALRSCRSAEHGDLTTPRVLVSGHPDADRNRRVPLDTWVVGGSSACKGLDGWGRPSVMSRSVLPSIEEWEQATAVRVHALEYVGDSCGAGRWRGAPAVRALVDLPSNFLYTVCCEGSKHWPQGTGGAQAGAPTSLMLLNEDNSVAGPVPVLAVEKCLAGRLLSLRGAGGAGYGSPLERAPEAVLTDVLDGLVSPDAAMSVYRIVLTPEHRSIDYAATSRLRGQER